MTVFVPPLAIARLLEALPCPWWVAGGWAVDLYLGRETRPHEDLEIAILRRDQFIVRNGLAGWAFSKVRAGRLDPWPEGEWLVSPIHEVHALRSEGHPRSFEILLNESQGDVWTFRRDRRVARPVAEIGSMSDLGVPFLRPEIVLLFKAKRPRPRDEEDFRLLSGTLSQKSREWLRGALAIVHPGHPWIGHLEGDI